MALAQGTYHAVWFKDSKGDEHRAVAQDGSTMLGVASYAEVKAHLASAHQHITKDETFVIGGDKRKQVEQTLRFLIAHSSQLPYSEGADRSSVWHTPPMTLGKPSDCSSMFRAVAEWNELQDPFGKNYNGSGNTLDIGRMQKHISQSQAAVGDGVLFGAAPGYWHVAHVLEVHPGNQLLLASHGSPGMRAITLKDEGDYHASTGHPGIQFVQLRTV